MLTTSPAAMHAFKTRTLALIDELKLPPESVVALGMSMAVSHGLMCGMDRVTLLGILDCYLDEADAAAKRALGGGAT